MPLESARRYVLPESLRSRLAAPLGELIQGSIEQTTPQLIERLKEIGTDTTTLLVGVGDVTADLLVNNNLNPHIIITDGKTKRQVLHEWQDFSGYEVLTADCPPGEITENAYKIILQAIEIARSEVLVHIKITGEEDLLVLPLLTELPDGSKIVYGQPNQGAVIRTVNSQSRKDAREILSMMN